MDKFNREQADNKLYEKMKLELSTFRNSLTKMKASEILSEFRPYELVYKEDLLMCFEYEDLNLSDEDVKFLLRLNEPLDWLYRSWCDSSTSHMSMLINFIELHTRYYREVHETK